MAEPVDAAEVPASDDESDPPVSATASPGLLATAAPIPRATASAPTRPMDVADDGACRRRPIVTGNGLHQSSRGIDIEAHLLGRTRPEPGYSSVCRVCWAFSGSGHFPTFWPVDRSGRDESHPAGAKS